MGKSIRVHPTPSKFLPGCKKQLAEGDLTMTGKTQAMRVLEGQKIKYSVASYPASERDAETIAEFIDAPARQVFKTLVVVRASGKPILAIVPANRQLNLKSLAKAVGEKKLQMASHKEAEQLTGLQVGGITALALLNRGFVCYVDDSVHNHEEVYISAGKKGLQIKLAPDDLQRVTGAISADIGS
jgi:Cys-tRNA(Pro)/Cys-tRNA(Cys) deacylase